MRNATMTDIRNARGVNWYGLDVGQRGPTAGELATYRQLGVTFLRLIVAWNTPPAEIDRILTECDVLGPYVGVEIHSYGKYPDGTQITADTCEQWAARCLDDLNRYGSHPSYVPLDMNEPSQLGAEWEKISQTRVDRLRGPGYKGVIGVSAAQASTAANINNAHKDGWWILDRENNCFLEVHHYLNGLNDSRPAQTRAKLDAWAKTQNQGVTTYVDYAKKSFGWGLFGSLTKTRADGTRKWDMPIYVGEFAYPADMLDLGAWLWQQYATQGAGATQWATGPWKPDYPWSMTPQQLALV